MGRKTTMVTYKINTFLNFNTTVIIMDGVLLQRFEDSLLSFRHTLKTWGEMKLVTLVPV